MDDAQWWAAGLAIRTFVSTWYVGDDSNEQKRGIYLSMLTFVCVLMVGELPLHKGDNTVVHDEKPFVQYSGGNVCPHSA